MTPSVLRLLAFTFTLVGCASLFYHLVEGWRFIDATYFAVMTIATVGYGDFVPKTDAGKLFTIFYIIVGLGLFVSTASAVAEAVLARRSDERRNP